MNNDRQSSGKAGAPVTIWFLDTEYPTLEFFLTLVRRKKKRVSARPSPSQPHFDQSVGTIIDH